MTSPGLHGANANRDLDLTSSLSPLSPLADRPAHFDTPAPDSYRKTAVHWRHTEVPAVRALFDALNAQDVRYSHWKSNIRLGETLAGEQDIDLLVDRRHLAQLQDIMARCGFKTTVGHAGVGHPGVFHALALDDSTGRLIDLHVYHAAMSGDSLVKSYCFPLTDALLDDCTRLSGVRIPRPELELLTFVVRTALKHTTPIEILKVNRNYHKTVAELAWLREAADPARLDEMRRQLLPALSQDLLQTLLEAMADDRAVLRRIGLGWRLAHRLRPLRRIGMLPALASRSWRLAAWLRGKAFRRGALSLSSGGAIIALVGPKGTGKSTLSRHIAARLSRHLDVRHIHAGKPPPSVLSALPTLCLPLARRLFPHERLSEYEKPENRHRRRYSLFHVARMTLLAYDRSRLLRRAFRDAASGELIVSDRYPSPTPGAIDSQCFDDTAHASAGHPLKRALMHVEKTLYRDMPPPQIVLRLVAPMEVAIARDAVRHKAGGPNAAAIRRRWDLETVAEFPGSHVITVETTGSEEDTIRRAMRAVWEAL